MKKAKSRKRDSVTKNARKKQSAALPKKTAKRNVLKQASGRKPAPPKTVDEYLAAAPQPARVALQQIRQAIRSVLPPEASEIISYRIPAFRHKKVLVWYGAFANHCSLFPTAALIEEFKDELKGFSTSKGTIHFPLDKPMPLELIKKIVRARIEPQSQKRP